jgi:hypothetical protein
MQQQKQAQSQKKSKYPSISRFITEYLLISAFFRYLFIIVFSFFVGLFVFGIAKQGSFLLQNLERQRIVSEQRSMVNKQIVYWENMAKEYPGSRDIYFKIAFLQYQIGAVALSKENLAISLQLDPNFQQARKLDEKITKED